MSPRTVFILSAMSCTAAQFSCSESSGPLAEADLADDTDQANEADTDAAVDTDTGTMNSLVDERVWDIAMPSGKHKIAFGNAPGLVLRDGEALFVYSEKQRVYTGYSNGVDAPVTTQLDAFANGMALAATGDDAVLFYTNQADHQMMARVSTDFGTSWSADVELGDGDTGPTVPTVCTWDEGGVVRSLAAWVAPPTSEDGGPMYVSYYDGVNWDTADKVGSSDVYSAPTLSCEDGRQTLVVREQVSVGVIDVMLFERDSVGTWTGGNRQFEGADPHLCVEGDDYWVGYHEKGSALMAHSTDAGANWFDTELDETGKFVPISCAANGAALACNGDWDSKLDANSKAPGRKLFCHVTFDGAATWQDVRPVGLDTEQSVTNAAMSDDGVAILWMSPDAVRFAMYSY
jgi:hypothetical protein